MAFFEKPYIYYLDHVHLTLKGSTKVYIELIDLIEKIENDKK